MIELSFCITCMNRIDQIKQTLRKNLDDNKKSKYNIEFILVDFDSKDGLKKYIGENFKEEIDSDYLKFYYTDQLVYWHSPIAKNTSHKLANGKYLVNLDCDNFTGELGGDWVIEQFKKYGDNIILHQSLNVYGSGTMGRIGMTKQNFIKLGGYDQGLKPMSHQDGDLILRARAFGFEYKNLNDEKYVIAIKNDKKKSLENCYGKINYNNLMKLNMMYSKFSIMSGQIIANNHFKDLQIGVFKKYLELIKF